MEPPNKLPKKEPSNLLKNSKCTKKTSQRRRIYSDTTVTESSTTSPRVANRPPLEDLNTNVIKTEQRIISKEIRKNQTVIFSDKDDGTSSSKTRTITSTHTKTETTLKLNNVTIKETSQVSTKTRHDVKFQVVEKRLYSLISFDNVLHGGKLSSPIKSNFYLPANIVVFEGIPKDVKKVVKKYTISRRSQPKLKENIAELFLDLYCTEYVEDIMLYQLKYDWKYILINNGTIKRFDPSARADVVNWLIKAQEYLNQPESILFTAVRLFDSILGFTDIPLNMYQLVSFVIMWIVIKFETNINFPTVKNIVKLCNNAYTVEQVLKLEKKLLGFFGFDFNVPDIIFYVNFYLIKLNSTSEVLYNSVLYILQCYVLNKNYSTIIPSVQAAGAVCLAFNILYPRLTVWETLTSMIGYYTKKDLDDVMQVMLQQIHKVQDPTYVHRYPYEKYSTKEKQQVSIILLGKLVAS